MSPLRRRVGHGLLLVSGLGYCVYFGALMLDTFVLVPLHKGGSIEFLREYYSSPFLPDLAAFFAPVVMPTLVTSILAWVALWKQPRWQAQTVSAIASVTVLLMLLFIFLPINFTPIDEYSDDELLANFSFWMTANWFRLAVVFIGLVGTARALGGMSRELLKLSGSLVHDYATISDDSPSPNRASRARRAATSAGIS